MIETINKYVQIWNSQKVKELPVVFSKSAIYQDSLQEGNAITVLTTSIEETCKAFSDISFEICCLIKDLKENVFVLEWLMKGTNTGSFFGAEPTYKKIHILGADIIHFENEKIKLIKSFYDGNQFTTQLEL